MQIAAPKFDEAEIDMVRKCLASGWVTQGPMVQQFEQLIGARHASRFALATTSCSAALHLATMALELQPGDEVIVPAFTWVTSAHCAEYVGAKAVFADIDLDTFNLDPAAAEAAITPRTKAIVVVHLFGKAAPMRALLAIAKRHGLKVIEDAACAIGTSYEGQPVGAMGDIGCFSFHPRKVITTGEGGLVTTNDAKLAERVRWLRNHGATGPAFGVDASKPYTMSTFEVLGYNLRLSDIQAAVGMAQFAKLDGLLAERRRLALLYSSTLAEQDEWVLPQDDAGHTYQSYVIRLRSGERVRRNAVMEHLAAHDIQTRPGTHAAHRLGYYSKKYRIQAQDFPKACVAEDSSITLPIFPGMSDAQVMLVAKQVAAGLQTA